MLEARELTSARRDGERFLSRCGSPHACEADTTRLPGSLLRLHSLLALVRCPSKLLPSRRLRITRQGQAVAPVARGGAPGAWRCGQNPEAAGTGCRGVSLIGHRTGGVSPCVHSCVHGRTICWSPCCLTRRQAGQNGCLCTRLCGCVPRVPRVSPGTTLDLGHQGRRAAIRLEAWRRWPSACDTGANDGPAGTEGLCGVTPGATLVCPGGWWHSWYLVIARGPIDRPETLSPPVHQDLQR